MKKSLLSLSLVVVLTILGGCKNEQPTPEPEPQQHVHTVFIDEKVDPGCDTTGLTKGSHCSTCGEILEKQKVIPSYHDQPTFEEILTTKHEGIDNCGLFKCPVCNQKFYKTITSKEIGLPVLSITGDFTGMSKDDKKKLHAVFERDGEIVFDSDCTLKWQGASSINYPKKNYNIQLFKNGTDYDKKEKVEVYNGWGKQSKYTLKANWIDASQLRNVVSGKLYGKVVRSRNIDDEFNKLINGGAIDGFPVFLFQNGAYQGLYTFNTPKDKWLLGMDGDENSREAMLMCDDWTNSGALQEDLKEDFSNGWELEYASTEDSKEIGTKWVSESFNKMSRFVRQSGNKEFVAKINDYVSLDRVIDSMLFTWLIRAEDNVSKNILWVTYDGVKWQPSVYDMDGVFGIMWNGSSSETKAWVPYTGNMLWRRIFENFKSEVVARYYQLREKIFSVSGIFNEFSKVDVLISEKVREAENKKWTGIPCVNDDHLGFISKWASKYYANMDAYFDSLNK